MADSDDYDPIETIPEFLQAKGSIGMLAVLYEHSRTYSELESEIDITSSTITRRRKDGEHLNILTVELESDAHGSTHEYELTDLGHYLAERLANKGMVSSYFQMRDRQREIEEKKEQIVEWVLENPANFVQFEAAREERLVPREDSGLPPELEEIQDAKDDTVDGSDTDDTGEEIDADDDRDQSETGTGEESFDRPPSPSDRMSDDAGGSIENKKQGTFEDITADEPESEQGDDESDS